MSKFKVGDKVVCISSWSNDEVSPSRYRIKGREYVVASVRLGWGGVEQINVLGAPGDCWHESAHYTLTEDKSKFHKHHDLIVAWAKGAKIEWKSKVDGAWHQIDTPTWPPSREYRIKPEPKPDVIAYTRAIMPDKPMSPQEAYERGFTSWASFVRVSQDNIKCVFDGETGKLKAVELLS